ncbi:GNAT family N-acetyltransferase [Tenacibaculum caenipelagi]|uniref:Ribosomal protein S18 acetylase RimI-like enzyme n=1 Tax=Tenacibaculum caenipelagi TaxID=1325435 RepID=A0A4R6TKN8_9FLAO|nr:GNAT family N-acetyltransferase [Tenacibaculum caenipelagi]TDQ30087.1 ribosomal protein S18 acetylase RimI-like enzyme [Tenacibaculum caenipelagi]
MNNAVNLKRTNSKDEDFVALVQELDKYLSGINGDQDDFFSQFNTIDALQNVVVCYVGITPVGCGAFKAIANKTVEIKRMYVKPTYRGKHIATLVLKELEKWAGEEQFDTVILETSKTMQPAVNLYQKNGYNIIANYEPYKDVLSSICFKKELISL